MKQNDNNFENLILELNKSGLAYLTHMNFANAITFLKKAQKLIHQQMQMNEPDEPKKLNQLAGITYNNLACYYKKTKKPKVALGYLKKALELEIFKISNWISAASTHLNICAIYSYLGQHQQSYTHASFAIELLEKTQNNQAPQNSSYIKVKMLAFYNKAIQLEYLKQYEQANYAYQSALELAKILPNHSVMMACRQAIERIDPLITNLRKKMINILRKRKITDQRGYGTFMRMNKRNHSNSQSHTITNRGLKFLEYHNQQYSSQRKIEKVPKTQLTLPKPITPLIKPILKSKGNFRIKTDYQK